MRYSLRQSDALDFLAALPQASIDLLITDPPYESLEKHRAVGTTTRLSHSKASSNAWFETFANDRFDELFAQARRVLKADAHFYLFCDATTMFEVVPRGRAAGFTFWKPLVWDKVQIGMGYHYRARYELILFFEQGKRRLANLGIADILTAKRVRDGYPTEKPVDLLRTLIEQSSQAGEVICDPFCGSGSSGVAALQLGRHFCGADIDEGALTLSRTRLEAAGGQEGLEVAGQLALL